ncbi:MAG: precorrin-2 C(20)-methyltransferase, partial [Odoribacter sp.]|nr:precorrin-2 C(20)-methyltransferase [Odoribacter sp.]
MYSPVTFVSLGPGDAELITLKALKALQGADIIFCPATLNSEGVTQSRAKELLLSLEIDNSKIVTFGLPMKKDRTYAENVYQNLSTQIEEKFNQGLKVAVTAEGDSGFYSSIHYIVDYLEICGIPYQQIAGVPAFIACGALAGIHIAKQEEAVEIIPGIIIYEELKEIIENGKTVVIMKASQCETIVKKAIMESGEIYFHYFENVGIEDKEIYT